MPEIQQLQKRTVDRMMVRIEHLDTLLGLAGEVIITSSNLHDLQRFLQEKVARGDPMPPSAYEDLKASDESAARISQDLHNLVMDIRLVEIGETLRLFRRPVRDLARSLGKEVDLVLEGADTLIDKALAERLVDPLLHILRNAVDHGVETPLERTRAGKETTGTIRVVATDKEHHTEIVISDDGRGIDAEGVLRDAREAGVAVADESDVLSLICRPGFSTRSEVTATSGRGVGLDLVESVVDDFGGEIDLDTEPGSGTTFTLHIPKLRAVNIVDALTVRAGPRLFAFPIEGVVSSLGVDRADIRTTMEKQRYITYLDEVVVLHDLQQLLGDAPEDVGRDPCPVIIIQGRRGRVALVVSEFLGPQKLVNVPLDEATFHVEGVAGTSVFTGGRIGLTLDVDELVDRAFGARPHHEEEHAEAEDAPDGASTAAARTPTEPSPVDEDVSDADKETPRKGESPETARLDRDDVSDLVDELGRSLADLQDALLTLEGDAENHEHLNRAFRLLHAAKGNFTMLESDAAADTAHHVETILDYLRNGRLSSTPERMDLLLDAVAWLTAAADALPDAPPSSADVIRGRLEDEIETTDESRASESEGDLIGRSFELSPTVELQVLSALKRGEHTYETFFSFHPGRQADFLVAYLILRRLGRHGTVLATLPSVDEIEQGNCGCAVKALWSSMLDESEVEEVLQTMAPQYRLQEFHSVPTTIFRYETGDAAAAE